MGFILFSVLAASSRPVLQVFSHLVYFPWLVACCAGMVKNPGPSMIPEVSLWLAGIFSFQLLFLGVNLGLSCLHILR